MDNTKWQDGLWFCFAERKSLGTRHTPLTSASSVMLSRTGQEKAGASRNPQKPCWCRHLACLLVHIGGYARSFPSRPSWNPRCMWAGILTQPAPTRKQHNPEFPGNQELIRVAHWLVLCFKATEGEAIFTICLVKRLQGWGDGLVNRVLTTQTWELEFRSPAPT